jgi:hypothetical protein
MADAEFAGVAHCLHLLMAVEHSESQHREEQSQQQTGYTTAAKVNFTHLSPTKVANTYCVGQEKKAKFS